MKKYMICAAAVLAGGLYLYISAATSSTTPRFIPLEIPNVGWSLMFDTSNMVKVHEDSNFYICKAAETNMLSGIVTKVMMGTAGTGSGNMQGFCEVVTEDIEGKPIIGSSPINGIAYYLTGKEYFSWKPFTGTTPANAVSGGTLRMTPAFVCRVNLGVEGYKAGLYDPMSKKCTVPFQGTLSLSSEFEVLTFEASCKK